MALPSDQARELVDRVRTQCSPDSELLNQFVQRRDADTFRALVERHGTMVLNLCQRMIGDAHLAEDAFQATFLVLARRAESIAKPESLSSWLYGTARHISNKARKKLPSPAVDQPNEILSPQRDPLAEISAREMLRIIEEELFRLPEMYRIPLILCTIEGLSVSEVADQLNTTSGSIRGRLERGREKLSQQLARRGIALPAALTTLLAVPRITVGENLRETVQTFASESILVSPQIDALAVTTASGSMKMKWFWIGFLFIAVGGGTTLLLTGTEFESQLQPEKKGITIISNLRVDRYGDPLPEGVITRFGTVRMRDCGEPIRFSSDGKFIACATGSSRSDVVIWDRQTGKEIQRLKGIATLENIILSPSGKRIGLKGNLDTLVFDVESGKELFRFRASDAVFTKEEKSLVALLSDGNKSTIQILNPDTGEKIKAIPANNPIGNLSSIRVNPEGRIVVLDRTKRDFEIRVFDLDKGEEISSLAANSEWMKLTAIRRVHLAPDGKQFSLDTTDEVSIWDIGLGKSTHRKSWSKRADSDAVISPDGKWVSWSGYDGVAHVWIASFDKGEPRRLGLYTNNFSTPAFSPDSKQVAYIDSGRALVVREIETGKEVNRFDAHTGAAKINDITPDGKHIISSDWNRILVWERQSGKLIHRLPEDLPQEETPLMNLIQSGHIVTQSLDQTIRLRDLVTLKEVARLDKKDGLVGNPNPVEMTFSEDRKSLALRGNNYDFRIFDLLSGKLRINHRPYVALGGIRLSADGRYLVAYQSLAPKEGYLPYVFDTQTKKEIKPKELPVELPFALEFPGHKKLVFGKELESWVKERNLLDENGKPIAENWNKVLNHFEMAPNGRFIAITRYLAPAGEKNREGMVRLQVWNTQTGQRLTHLPFSPPFMTSVRFSSDSRFLLDTDREGVTRIQEVASGAIRFEIKGHFHNDASSLVFTPDYRGLLTGGTDTQILLWDFTNRSPDGTWRTTAYSPEQQKQSWEIVGSDDSKKAHRAIWELVADPSGTVKFLNEKLRPIEKPDPKQIAKLIEQTDSDTFAVREKAFADLTKIGELALPMIREKVKKPNSVEQKQRLEKLLAILENPILSGEKLQAVRGIEILERLNTSEAKKLLEELGTGTPESFLTQEARQASHRMK